MTFDSLLDHHVYVTRDVETGADDDYGHPVTMPEIGELFAAALQPKGVREVAAATANGATVGDWRIFCRPRLLTTADAIIHDTDRCPKPPGQDLPTLRFEITGIHNGAGRGHHLEADARAIGVPQAVEAS